MGGAPRKTRPATHLVLRVTDAGPQWQADVGFGLGTLLDPIPFGPAGVHEQSGWSFQVVQDGDELTLQTLGTNGWADVCLPQRFGLPGFGPGPDGRVADLG